MINIYPKPVQKMILQKVAEIKPSLDLLPGVAMILDMQDGAVIHANRCAEEQLGVSTRELQEMGNEYHSQFFKPEESKEYAPKMMAMLERNDPSETYTIFQQVKFRDGSWNLHLTSMRIFLQDDEGKPLALILTSQLIDPDFHYTPKIERVIEELNFLREHMKTYSNLSARERTVLGYIAANESSAYIADQLHISVATVDTHRKNIRRKLHIKNTSELTLYARAFNLV